MNRSDLIEKRIRAFIELGRYMRNAGNDPAFRQLETKIQAANVFFTPEYVERAVVSWGHLLEETGLRAWVGTYAGKIPESPKNIAVIMAGNIPIVGFHDYLCVLLCGHSIQVKLSSKDPFLLPFLHRKMAETAPEGSGFHASDTPAVCFTENEVKHFDAIIATGSGNTFRYFDYYFGKYPHLLRRNRTSCAVLTGGESREDIRKLGDDIFSYFGLGCRNVSKLYLPFDTDMAALSALLAPAAEKAALNRSYKNNYDYYKSIYWVNRRPHFDTGAALLTQSGDLASPMSVIYYETYRDYRRLADLLKSRESEIQCIVGSDYLPFGQAQSPGLDDYADGVDVPDFLCSAFV